MAHRNITLVGTNGLVASGSERVADNSLVVTFTQATQVGDRLLLAISTDNLSTTTPTVSTVVDSRSSGSNTWTSVAAPNASSNTAAAAVVLRVLRCTVAVAHQVGDTLTITLSGNVTAKAGVVLGIRGVGANIAAGIVSSQGTTGSPALNVTPASVGDIVVGFLAAETNVVSAGDTDTLNGSWSTPIGVATSGTAASQAAISVQTKIVTATGQQTFNAPAANDWAAVAFTIAREVVPGVMVSWAALEAPVVKPIGRVRVSAASLEAPNAIYSDPVDASVPVRQLMTVDGSTLRIYYDELITANLTTLATVLTVQVNGGSATAVQSVTKTNNLLTCTLTTPVVAGDTVAVTYDRSFIVSADRIQDPSGNMAAAFSVVSATNITPSLGSFVKIWDGSVWVLKPLKRWNGSAWVDAVLKRWDGSAWVANNESPAGYGSGYTKGY